VDGTVRVGLPAAGTGHSRECHTRPAHYGCSHAAGTKKPLVSGGSYPPAFPGGQSQVAGFTATGETVLSPLRYVNRIELRDWLAVDLGLVCCIYYSGGSKLTVDFKIALTVSIGRWPWCIILRKIPSINGVSTLSTPMK